MATLLTLTDAAATFLANGVKIGDEVIPTGIALVNIEYDNLYVSEIVGETSLKVSAWHNGAQISISSANMPAGTYAFNVVHHFTKDEMVANILAIGAGYAEKRVTLIWPPESVWDVDGVDVTLNGTALAAAYAAAKSSLPAQQSMTNMPFAGPKQLNYSNTYFNKRQLDALSNGGVCVLVQDAPGANVYARHQRTTSTVSIQEQEQSIVNAVDKLSLDLYATAKPYIGKYNISQELLTQLDEVLTQQLFKAKNVKAQYCGSLIISYTNLSIRANLEGNNLDLPPGTTEISLTVEVGYPNNYINIKLFVN